MVSSEKKTKEGERTEEVAAASITHSSSHNLAQDSGPSFRYEERESRIQMWLELLHPPRIVVSSRFVVLDDGVLYFVSKQT